MAIDVLQAIESLLAGAIISLAGLMLFNALGAFGLKGPFFWLALIVIIAIGVVQYRPGNLSTLNFLALGIMIFSYFALGPYSAYVVSVTEQIGAPIKAISAGAQTALSDVWLLVTNPTEYFARQQLRAVRPEKPIDFPKGIEVTQLQAFPTGMIPAGEEFVVFLVIENEGTEDAMGVRIKASCTEIGGLQAKCRVLDANREEHDTLELPEIASMRPGQAERFEFRFKAGGRVGREPGQRVAETVFNKAVFEVSYSMSTSSSLSVEIATPEEINRRALTGEGRFYFPEVATAKVGPSQLGMTVGPQPLKPGRATLIASIINTRYDGNLSISNAFGTSLRIKPSPSITIKDCRSPILVCAAGGGEEGPNIGSCTPPDTGLVAVEAQRPLGILCDLQIGEITGPAKTDLLLGELANYRFTLLKDIRIPVTAPREALVPKELKQ